MKNTTLNRRIYRVLASHQYRSIAELTKTRDFNIIDLYNKKLKIIIDVETFLHFHFSLNRLAFQIQQVKSDL
jgi:hypothetical protein